MPIHTNTQLLQMALIGCEAEREKIHEKIAELQRELGGRVRGAGVLTSELAAKRGRRHMSAAAKKRIAEAQKKRWAEYRKKNAA